MWKEVTRCVWSSMQRLSEQHCCAGRHQAMTDLEKEVFQKSSSVQLPPPEPRHSAAPSELSVFCVSGQVFM